MKGVSDEVFEVLPDDFLHEISGRVGGNLSYLITLQPIFPIIITNISIM
jgi:hypothetical protein